MVKRWAIFSEKNGYLGREEVRVWSVGTSRKFETGLVFSCNLLSLVDMESTKNSEDRD